MSRFVLPTGYRISQAGKLSARSNSAPVGISITTSSLHASRKRPALISRCRQRASSAATARTDNMRRAPLLCRCSTRPNGSTLLSRLWPRFGTLPWSPSSARRRITFRRGAGISISSAAGSNTSSTYSGCHGSITTIAIVVQPSSSRCSKGIWTEDEFTFHGDFYNIDGYHLNPKPTFKPHPLVFQGGSSTAARRMAAGNSDLYFTNGGPIEELRAQAMQVKQGAAGFGRQLRVGANAFIIARDTEAEAREVHAEIVAKADPSAVAGFAEAVKQAGQSTADGIGNWAKSSAADLVQPNDGFKTNLIGTPEQVARRIVALKRAGIDLVLAGFLHFQEEVEYFGRRVYPLVRELEAEAANKSPEVVLAG